MANLELDTGQNEWKFKIHKSKQELGNLIYVGNLSYFPDKSRQIATQMFNSLAFKIKNLTKAIFIKIPFCINCLYFVFTEDFDLIFLIDLMHYCFNGGWAVLDIIC